MGFFDTDGGSTVSRRSSRHHSSKHRDRDEKSRFLEVRKTRSRSRSRARSHSRARSVGTSASRSFFGLDGGHREKERHRKSANASFFSLPNVSSRSIFGTFSKAAGMGGSSYYRRSPRSSFLQRAFKKLKRLLRDLLYYAKKHPVKVFMLAIMPLITGGALTALLARFGVRLPASIERMMGMGARAMTGDSVGLVGEAVRMAGVAGAGARVVSHGAATLERNRRGDLQWERRSTERDYFGGGGGQRNTSQYYDSRSYYDTRSDAGSGWGGSLAGIKNIFS